MKKIYKKICSILLGNENQDHNFQTTIGIFVIKYFVDPVTNFCKEIIIIYGHGKRILFQKRTLGDLGLIEGVWVLIITMVVLVALPISNGWTWLKNKWLDLKNRFKNYQANKVKKIAA